MGFVSTFKKYQNQEPTELTGNASVQKHFKINKLQAKIAYV